MGEVTAYIGLGSNLGDRIRHIEEAVRRLGETPGVKVLKRSALRETKPVGKTDQPDFMNGVVAIETTLEPLPLFDRLLAIEAELGRVRRKRWGPRVIDLDLLLYGDQTVRTPRLTVPHPEMQKREFVLTPLHELKEALHAR